eukprot:388678_1
MTNRNREYFRNYLADLPRTYLPLTRKICYRTLPQLILPESRVTAFDMTFDHISNAITHELYDAIAASFTNIAEKLEMKEVDRNGIDQVLNELKKTKIKKKKIQEIEIDYIKQLTERALAFKPSLQDHNRENNKPSGTFDSDVDGLCIDTLHDIYNIHRCFLFTNYRLIEYPQAKFLNDFQNNKYFSKYKANSVFSHMIKSIESNQIPSIDLFPQYIIDDDMYTIWNIFFATSHLSEKIRNSNIVDVQVFSLKVVVIPNRVVSVYDPLITFPHSISDINYYLKEQQCESLVKPFFLPLKHSGRLISAMMSILMALEFVDGVGSLIIIVDRRRRISDILYAVIPPDSKKNQFSELDSNYFLSLKFNINFNQTQNGIKCHLFYGCNSNSYTRFYPEHLTSI